MGKTTDKNILVCCQKRCVWRGMVDSKSEDVKVHFCNVVRRSSTIFD